jgi:hypothetical protein
VALGTPTWCPSPPSSQPRHGLSGSASVAPSLGLTPTPDAELQTAPPSSAVDNTGDRFGVGRSAAPRAGSDGGPSSLFASRFQPGCDTAASELEPPGLANR